MRIELTPEIADMLRRRLARFTDAAAQYGAACVAFERRMAPLLKAAQDAETAFEEGVKDAIFGHEVADATDVRFHPESGTITIPEPGE